MSRQNSNFQREFSEKFLNCHGYEYAKSKPDGSGQNYDNDAYNQHYPNGYNQGISREAYNASSEHKPTEQCPRRYNQNARGGAFNASSEHHHHRQTQQRGRDSSIRHTSSYLAGGDGNTQDVGNNQIADTRDVRSNYMQQEETQNSDATYNKRSNSSSRFSNSSKETAVERSVGRRGKQLLNLTLSKANLIQTVEETMNDLQQKHIPLNQKSVDLGRTSNGTFNCESESSNACSSPSAGVINNKIIHPMVKRFRLLYLNSIKEEVGILQELEELPHKLTEICKKLENKK